MGVCKAVLFEFCVMCNDHTLGKVLICSHTRAHTHTHTHLVQTSTRASHIVVQSLEAILV